MGLVEQPAARATGPPARPAHPPALAGRQPGRGGRASRPSNPSRSRAGGPTPGRHRRPGRRSGRSRRRTGRRRGRRRGQEDPTRRRTAARSADGVEPSTSTSARGRRHQPRTQPGAGWSSRRRSGLRPAGLAQGDLEIDAGKKGEPPRQRDRCCGVRVRRGTARAIAVDHATGGGVPGARRVRVDLPGPRPPVSWWPGDPDGGRSGAGGELGRDTSPGCRSTQQQGRRRPGINPPPGRRSAGGPGPGRPCRSGDRRPARSTGREPRDRASRRSAGRCRR